MGKGDKKTRRGKIVIGSYGVRRPRRIKKAVVVVNKGAQAKPKKVQEKPQKLVEEAVVMIEPVIVSEPVVEAPVKVEIAVETKPVKSPAKKAAVKKTVEKAEKVEKPLKTDVGEAKPKATKTKKKAADPVEGKEKSKE